ncbi:hypothetical protein DPQ22_04210 [Candidatus Tokpelaia sp.]|nr:hypothetical protein DPQ22_04210 [Candidatus Tokpelaia sp.]
MCIILIFMSSRFNCSKIKQEGDEIMTADFGKAQKKAAEILKEYRITKPPIDPEAIAEEMGVDVRYADFSPDISKKISGFIRFNRDSGNAPQIIVNKAVSPRRKIFTIAHELGHYLLHRDYAEDDNRYQVMPRSNFYPEGKPPEEQEADCFAANLLVPEDMLRKYSAYASIETIEKLAGIFAVSKEVILDRMRFLGV